MSDTKKSDDELVVLAGSVTVKRQVGAGMAYVDVAAGEPVGDIDDETREGLLKRGAIGRRDGKPYEGGPARPVPAEVEPDEIDKDIIPAGSVEQILAWVGDDLARARVAKDMEQAKGLKARGTLLKALEDIKVKTETEPPEVPEFFTGDVSLDAAPGGVATPVDDSAVEDKTASEAPASKRSGR